MKKYCIEENDMAMMYRALNEIRVQGIVQARAVSIMAAILDGAKELKEEKSNKENLQLCRNTKEEKKEG